MSYLTASDTFDCNYTSGANRDEAVQLVQPDDFVTDLSTDTDGVLIFKFPWGITYADIITCNFTMTVDPNSIRQKGSGNEDGAVVAVAVCEQQQIDSFPGTAGDKTYCGDHEVATVTAEAPGIT